MPIKTNMYTVQPWDTSWICSLTMFITPNTQIPMELDWNTFNPLPFAPNSEKHVICKKTKNIFYAIFASLHFCSFCCVHLAYLAELKYTFSHLLYADMLFSSSVSRRNISHSLQRMKDIWLWVQYKVQNLQVRSIVSQGTTCTIIK